jgi:hypothetical protein
MSASRRLNTPVRTQPVNNGCAPAKASSATDYDAHRRAEAAIGKAYKGRYMVMWSEYSQTYIAWATWQGTGGEMIADSDPEELIRRMDAQLAANRVHPL